MYNLQNIKRIAEKKNISIREIANNCSISDTGLHKSIANNTISLESLYKIADYLKVTITELIAEEHEFKPTVKITDGNEYIAKRFEELIRENEKLEAELKIYKLDTRGNYTMQDVPALKVAESEVKLKTEIDK